ncbi:ABC transporter ATP-binding protein [Rhodoplanes sp. TEM]|uniref:ABC transporter ATP-binding protein n=1 Tax=Rhodoplanes tepidamans TaxID=200616 RepID=A0ABT5J958_RHOTP|nr:MULTISPECIES: ABC transporter ATP-binding protein [Rhodoplanes]MDC7785600.1 ABC transporter ATP-binding protein [Rhodoplanes tepidamans]MDC7985701.1 ABC transporter ATP-binding protein [Rhodoplanes sp. TEM]MDQ0354834.1 NitT/TauT family transport system ATP-binding protein [Rhodoplanes tepidamans]
MDAAISAAASGPAPATDAPPYMSVQRVQKIYETAGGAVEAVSLADFSVTSGEFVAVLGPSGCGKSTLMMMIGGLETTSAGHIRVDGTEVTAPRGDFGYVFQDATLLPWKSVLDNVLFPIRLEHGRTRDHLDRARELLELVGLWDFRDKRPRQLSGGMRQRVAICRGLINDPKLLLMDEPFSALDAISRDDMNAALADLWDRYHKTAIFITHSIREAVYLADRVLVMSRRPSVISHDVRIPFPRPRRMEMQETAEFNEICGFLRRKIEEGYQRA